MNALTRINVPVGRSQSMAIKESVIHQKHGRPIGSKDSTPQKRRIEQLSSYPFEETCNAPKEVPPEQAHNTPKDVIAKSILSRIMEVPGETLEALEEAPIPDNKELSIIYNYSRERWNINEITIDYAFAYAIAI